MTLPYQRFPFQRALQGIKESGFEYVAWGTKHVEKLGEEPLPLLPIEAPPHSAKQLAQQCRDLGLEPVMMFSTVYPEDKNALSKLASRIRQAGAAGIRQVLTFGHSEGSNLRIWIERLRKLAPIAGDHQVILVIKQHGGATGTGQACAQIVREVDHANIRINYDAGNVMDYLDIDPIQDIQACADLVRSFCIKDHRNWPQDEDCGPGFGQIDHYRLLHTVGFTGRDLPLCCENVFAPLVSPPSTPEDVDKLASRAREFLATVISGIQRQPNE
ncbi:sugar phosphate isomerase/epimerase family protein [Bythopirellula goksoeyrii]|nr:TIM barrel protein [Bythopirellula goksoeyrii]